MPDGGPENGMSRQLGLAVVAGLASAVLFLLMGEVLPPLVYLAPLPLFAAGLGLGFAACLVAAVVGLAGVGAASGFGALVPYAATSVLPVLVMVRQSLLWRTRDDGGVEWYPPGLLLGWLVGLGLAGMTAAAMLAPSHPDGLEGLIREQVMALTSGIETEVGPEAREAIVALWVPFLPAMVAAAWLVVSVGNGAFAQAMLVRGGRNLRPTPSYSAVEVPDWVAAVLVAGVAGAWIGDGSLGYAARNVAAFALVPYVFLGLAGVHGAVRDRPNGTMLLAVFYGLFFLVFGWAVVIVAGLGLIRHWTKLRRRIAGGRQEDE